MPLTQTADRAVRSALGWTAALATEVVLLPTSLRDLRRSVAVLGELPDHISRLSIVLDATSATLEEHVPELSRTVVGGIDQRVIELAATVDGFGTRLDRLADALDQAAPALGGLPSQLEGFDATVEELGTQVTTLTDQLAEVLPDLSRVVGDELPQRVQHLDEVVSELSATVTAVLGSIPGVRRSVRSGT